MVELVFNEKFTMSVGKGESTAELPFKLFLGYICVHTYSGYQNHR